MGAVFPLAHKARQAATTKHTSRPLEKFMSLRCSIVLQGCWLCPENSRTVNKGVLPCLVLMLQGRLPTGHDLGPFVQLFFMFPQRVSSCREVLRDDIIPYAVKWFTGEAQMEDSDEEDFELDEDEEV